MIVTITVDVPDSFDGHDIAETLDRNVRRFRRDPELTELYDARRPVTVPALSVLGTTCGSITVSS